MTPLAGWGYCDWAQEPVAHVATQPELIMQVLAEGPATSTEVSAETGLSVRHCSAVLSSLHRRKRVSRQEFMRSREHGSTAYLYSLRGEA